MKANYEDRGVPHHVDPPRLARGLVQPFRDPEMTRRLLDYVIAGLAILAACGIIFAVTTAAGAAQDYPPNSVGRLLYGYTDQFRDGYLSGVAEGLFVSGMTCPGIVSGGILREALKSEVVAGRVALTDHDIRAVMRTAAALGCSAPWGTKGTTWKGNDL